MAVRQVVEPACPSSCQAQSSSWTGKSDVLSDSHVRELVAQAGPRTCLTGRSKDLSDGTGQSEQSFNPVPIKLQKTGRQLKICTKNPPANGWIPSRAPATWLRSIQRTLGRAWHHLDASESVQGMLGRRDHPEDGVQPGVHRTLDWECPMDNKKTINRTLLRVSD
ncbi:hypothetical protein PGT21_030508 [Puccinia graminis f. sp. tritici]|uniref:Uncharacterized protein n=1 Tax=Puccinia graminis f. sp. tritici TaxID=56615 RepID=A0A5B0PZ56_PUCGR|nr:hypothetical protein PGT21_030508 [Puccinia graminis f. sp. tritici]